MKKGLIAALIAAVPLFLLISDSHFYPANSNIAIRIHATYIIWGYKTLFFSCLTFLLFVFSLTAAIDSKFQKKKFNLLWLLSTLVLVMFLGYFIQKTIIH